jgi:hypothetical protein
MYHVCCKTPWAIRRMHRLSLYRKLNLILPLSHAWGGSAILIHCVCTLANLLCYHCSPQLVWRSSFLSTESLVVLPERTESVADQGKKIKNWCPERLVGGESSNPHVVTFLHISERGPGGRCSSTVNAARKFWIDKKSYDERQKGSPLVLVIFFENPREALTHVIFHTKYMRAQLVTSSFTRSFLTISPT